MLMLRERTVLENELQKWKYVFVHLECMYVPQWSGIEKTVLVTHMIVMFIHLYMLTHIQVSSSQIRRISTKHYK